VTPPRAGEVARRPSDTKAYEAPGRAGWKPIFARVLGGAGQAFRQVGFNRLSVHDYSSSPYRNEAGEALQST
jgi:hypothetical protein